MELCLIVIAGALTAALYRDTLRDGFYYDDYHFVRPHALTEVVHAFRGPWDATGIEVPFYRPLTVAYFALRFEALGYNAVAYHALSLSLFALAAALIATFVYAATTRDLLAALAPVAVF